MHNKSNINNIPNSKHYERFTEHYELSSKDNKLNFKKQISNLGINQSNLRNISQGTKRQNESNSRNEYQENFFKNDLYNKKDNLSNKGEIRPDSKNKIIFHERKRSLLESKNSISFIEANKNMNLFNNTIYSNNFSNNNLLNNKEFRVFKKISKKIAGKSKAGRLYDGSSKTNQDSYLIKTNIFHLDNFSIFGVFDGHGSHGHFVSNMIKHFFSEYFSKPELYINHQANTKTKSSFNGNPKNNMFNRTNFNTFYPNSINNNNNNNNNNNQNANNNLNVSEEQIYKKLKAQNFNILRNSFTFAEATIALSKYEVNFSGSTCVLIFQISNKLICANAGDSRGILITQKSNQDYIVALSRDHKPELKDEMTRINKSNGRVEKFSDKGVKSGPFRVWLKNQNYPGLAMSRSIGDLVAGSVGVICEPEIYECEVTDKAKFAVIASDGIWEFLSNEKVAEIVNPFYQKDLDVDGAAEKLVEEATKCWRRVIFNIFNI